MKPLFIALRNEFYLMFQGGTKHYEIRKYCKRWNEEKCKVGRLVTLSNGYQKKGRLNLRVIDFKKVFGSRLSKSDKKAVIGCWGAEALDGYFSIIFVERNRQECSNIPTDPML